MQSLVICYTYLLMNMNPTLLESLTSSPSNFQTRPRFSSRRHPWTRIPGGNTHYVLAAESTMAVASEMNA